MPSAICSVSAVIMTSVPMLPWIAARVHKHRLDGGHAIQEVCDMYTVA